MAEIKKISGLTSFSTTEALDSTDLIIVEDSSTGDIHKVTLQDISDTHTHSSLLATAVLNKNDWDSTTLSQTLDIAGATHLPGKGVILVTPTSRQDADTWCDYGVYLDNTESRENKVRFTCLSVPTSNISVYVHLVS